MSCNIHFLRLAVLLLLVSDASCIDSKRVGHSSHAATSAGNGIVPSTSSRLGIVAKNTDDPKTKSTTAIKVEKGIVQKPAIMKESDKKTRHQAEDEKGEIDLKSDEKKAEKTPAAETKPLPSAMKKSRATPVATSAKVPNDVGEASSTKEIKTSSAEVKKPDIGKTVHTSGVNAISAGSSKLEKKEELKASRDKAVQTSTNAVKIPAGSSTKKEEVKTSSTKVTKLNAAGIAEKRVDDPKKESASAIVVKKDTVPKPSTEGTGHTVNDKEDKDKLDFVKSGEKQAEKTSPVSKEEETKPVFSVLKKPGDTSSATAVATSIDPPKDTKKASSTKGVKTSSAEAKKPDVVHSHMTGGKAVPDLRKDSSTKEVKTSSIEAKKPDVVHATGAKAVPHLRKDSSTMEVKASSAEAKKPDAVHTSGVKANSVPAKKEIIASTEVKESDAENAVRTTTNAVNIPGGSSTQTEGVKTSSTEVKNPDAINTGGVKTEKKTMRRPTTSNGVKIPKATKKEAVKTSSAAVKTPDAIYTSGAKTGKKTMRRPTTLNGAKIPKATKKEAVKTPSAEVTKPDAIHTSSIYPPKNEEVERAARQPPSSTHTDAKSTYMDKYKDKLRAKRDELVKKHPLKFEPKTPLEKDAKADGGTKDTLTLQKISHDLKRKKALEKYREKLRKKALRKSSQKVDGMHNRRSRPLKPGERVFNKIPIIKRAYRKTPLEEAYSDATLSFVHSLKQGNFNADKGPLDFRRKEALRDWLNLLTVALPPELELHSLIDDLRSNIDLVYESKTKLEVVLKKHPIKEKLWSKTCSASGKAPTSKGFYCGFWKLLHIVSVGLAEHRGGLDNGSELRVTPMKAGDTLREFMAHFFGCESCSRTFVAQYDECRFRRCDRLADYADGLTDEQWREFPLWLWEVHNEVNVRVFSEHKTKRNLVGGDEISAIWPQMEQCVQCIREDGTWNEDLVHQHMVETYWSGPESDSKDDLLNEYERSLERPASNFVFYLSMSVMLYVAWMMKKRYIRNTGMHKKDDSAMNGTAHAKLKPGPPRSEELKWRRI